MSDEVEMVDNEELENNNEEKVEQNLLDLGVDLNSDTYKNYVKDIQIRINDLKIFSDKMNREIDYTVERLFKEPAFSIIQIDDKIVLYDNFSRYSKRMRDTEQIEPEKIEEIKKCAEKALKEYTEDVVNKCLKGNKGDATEESVFHVGVPSRNIIDEVKKLLNAEVEFDCGCPTVVVDVCLPEEFVTYFEDKLSEKDDLIFASGLEQNSAFIKEGTIEPYYRTCPEGGILKEYTMPLYYLEMFTSVFNSFVAEPYLDVYSMIIVDIIKDDLFVVPVNIHDGELTVDEIELEEYCDAADEGYNIADTIGSLPDVYKLAYIPYAEFIAVKLFDNYRVYKLHDRFYYVSTYGRYSDRYTESALIVSLISNYLYHVNLGELRSSVADYCIVRQLPFEGLTSYNVIEFLLSLNDNRLKTFLYTLFTINRSKITWAKANRTNQVLKIDMPEAESLAEVILYFSNLHRKHMSDGRLLTFENAIKDLDKLLIVDSTSSISVSTMHLLLPKDFDIPDICDVLRDSNTNPEFLRQLACEYIASQCNENVVSLFWLLLPFCVFNRKNIEISPEEPEDTESSSEE